MSHNGDWKKPVKAILSAIKIDSPNQFKFGDRIFPVAVQAHGQANGDGALVNNLAAQLYEYAYSRTFTGKLAEKSADFSADAQLIEQMSRANATRERWEHGWIISQVMHGGQIVAYHGNQSRELWPGQYISKDGPLAIPRVGAEISIFNAKESRSLQGGFYYAFGESVEDHRQGFGLVRLYWNLVPDGAPRFVAQVTARLNRFQVPFRLKCLTARNQFDRTDVCVIYVTKRYFRIVAELLLDVHPALDDVLREDVPLFSKKLAKGLSTAEDPGSGESFGQSRCQRLAQSIWDCYQAGTQSADNRLKRFRALLVQSRIDPDHVHLNAGSLDWYQLPKEF
jgi:hypothetical protein